ncbi:hypothetical protein N4G39_10185 [Microbacterium testaceum]|nr:hypothetical protein [Microbacterium testaceum]
MDLALNDERSQEERAGPFPRECFRRRDRGHRMRGGVARVSNLGPGVGEQALRVTSGCCAGVCIEGDDACRARLAFCLPVALDPRGRLRLRDLPHGDGIARLLLCPPEYGCVFIQRVGCRGQ